jgi:NADH:ubiquinone oxidoreductase subunit 3 (subunit A)
MDLITGIGLFSIIFFYFILFLGFFYEWYKWCLEWN